MPRSRNRSDSGSFTLSFKTLGAIVAAFTLIAGVWQAGDKIATKVDLQTTQQRISALEDRVRAAELQMARFFGAHPEPSSYQKSSLKLASYGEEAAPARRVVVTTDFVRSHELQPTRGGSYSLLGEDGRYYALDDVIAILVREHSKERREK